MKLVNCELIILISFLCLLEFGSTKQNTEDCDSVVSGNALAACSILEFCIVSLTMLCTVQKSLLDSGNFISCVANHFVSPYKEIFQKFMNGLVEGGYWGNRACPKGISVFRSKVNAVCPTMMAKLNNDLIIPVQKRLGFTQQTSATFKPMCGVKGSIFEACSLIESYTIFILIICKFGKMFIKMNKFLLCLANYFKLPFGNIFKDFFYGFIKGTVKSVQTCNIPLNLYTSNVKTMCPRIFLDVNNILVDMLGNLS